jgi:chromosome segregation ATPase
MSDTAIEDIYRRLNSLTEDVTSLKIQAGTIGTTQVAVAQNLNLLIALTGEVREFKATTNADLTLLKTDVGQLKADVSQLKTEMREVKADLRQVSNDVTEVLRILRDRNGGSGL